MNDEVNYDDKLERKNNSNRISGVIPEEENKLTTAEMNYHTVRKYRQGSINKTALSTHSPQDCVDKTTKKTIQAN